MKFNLINKIENTYDIEFIPCFTNDEGNVYQDIFKSIKDNKGFSGKKCTTYEVTKNNENLTKLVFIGLGDKSSLTYEDMYKIFVSSFKCLKFNKKQNILIHGFNTDLVGFNNILKGIVLSLNACEYSFAKYISEKERDKEEINIYIFSDLIEDISEYVNIGHALNLTRDLVNEPANILTPDEFSKRCISSIRDLNMDIEVYDENWIQENNLKALYEVGKASINKPRFIVIKYFGNKESKKTISFVGKGLTYDSGGYSIKSSDGMVTMKCDMAGAASVLSLMTLIAKQNLKINAYGIIPTCENVINGNGFKPGDIISSLSGKTIEIISTDAEGRLVLADGVYYAAKNLNTDIIIDVATLTGACGIALGTKYAAVIDNNEEIFNELNRSSQNTVESIWRLPGDKEYLDMLKSEVADLKNIGGRYGGTITAGLFIGEFVDNKPWAHIDIAYVAWNDTKSKIFPHKGGTGAIVELLYNFCKNSQGK